LPETPPIESPEVTGKDSVAGSLTITEDEYEQITIWKRTIPTSEKPIYYNENIK
jgi:hypothetical protein